MICYFEIMTNLLDTSIPKKKKLVVCQWGLREDEPFILALHFPKKEGKKENEQIFKW